MATRSSKRLHKKRSTGDQPDHHLAKHSYVSKAPKQLGHTITVCKSDVNVVCSLPKTTYSLSSNCTRKLDIHTYNSIRSLGEYYKKYEHDEVPVKDSNFQEIPHVGDKGSLTNSELEKLEMKIFQNMSQELQTDDNSISSLESNMKFFKTTVQEIFDNFYASMRDFELYKKRFHKILAKNEEEAIADMEEFIKDMIQHIMSTESTSTSNDSKKSNDTISFRDKDTHISNLDEESSVGTETYTNSNCYDNSGAENVNTVIEAYKNDNYLTDSTLEEKTTKAKIKSPSVMKNEEIFNIFLLSGSPHVQIKMNDRNLLSEINIKEPSLKMKEGKHVASADNIERLAAKKMELEKYVKQQQECALNNSDLDREVPVKVSYAKKNIHLDEDFSQDHDSEKSFISKICNFLCRKFRKTS